MLASPAPAGLFRARTGHAWRPCASRASPRPDQRPWRPLPRRRRPRPRSERCAAKTPCGRSPTMPAQDMSVPRWWPARPLRAGPSSTTQGRRAERAALPAPVQPESGDSPDDRGDEDRALRARHPRSAGRGRPRGMRPVRDRVPPSPRPRRHRLRSLSPPACARPVVGHRRHPGQPTLRRRTGAGHPRPCRRLGGSTGEVPAELSGGYACAAANEAADASCNRPVEPTGMAWARRCAREACSPARAAHRPGTRAPGRGGVIGWSRRRSRGWRQ